MSSFDDKLTNHIRDRFDQYHEEIDPKGFDGLRGSLLEFNATQKRIIYYRYLAAALVLMVLSGIFYWMDPLGNRGIDAESTLALQSPPTNSQVEAIPDSSNVSIAEIETDTADGIQSSKNAESLQDHLVNVSPEKFDSTDDLSSPQKSTSDTLSTRNFASTSPSLLSSLNRRERLEGINSGLRFSDSIMIDEISMSEFQAENFESSSMRPLRDGLKKSDVLDHVELLSGDYTINSPEKTVLMSRNADFIVVPRQKDVQSTQIIVGSTVNFMRDHDAQGTGFLAGAMHHVRINNTVSLSMGGLFSINQLQFSNTNSNSQSTIPSNLPDIVSAGDNLSFNVGRDFDIHYTALDIPMNAKINLGAFRNGQYNFAIGLSSLWYIQQSLIERGITYNGFATMDGETGNISVSFSSSDYEMTRKPKAFNQFDFAKLMNISLGYASLRNYESFELELYVKYPLGNITEGNYSFGMGGVTLKYKL